MKYFVVLVLGFLTGVGAGLGGLYYNPLTRESGFTLTSTDQSLNYESPITAGLVFTHGGLSRLPTHPASVPELWEATLNKTALSVLALAGADGEPRAVASRISLLSERTELLTGGALLRDNWLVSVPGEGSLVITADANWWPFLRETLIPVWYFGREWRGPSGYAPTAGPAAGGAALLRGVSGAYAGRSGVAAERYQIEAFDQRVGPGKASAELAWQFAQ
ncbi:MAG TPA: hypothetical protein VGC50_16840 [Gammaproteobacteria bacterium]|jgi:hypothetical protein